MSESVDPPSCYLSIRVTIAHDEWETLVRVLSGGSDLQYIGYPHSGRDGSNPHFHVLIPSVDARAAERFRNRLKRHFGTQENGNKIYSISARSNGLLSGIQYCSKEGTEPVLSGPELQSFVDSAPPWEHRNIGNYMTDESKKRKIDPMHHYPITARNLLKVTLDYRKRKGIPSKELSSILEAMHSDNWFLDMALIRNGIPATFFDEFTARCDGRTAMTASRFDRMRVAETWRAFGI